MLVFLDTEFTDFIDCELISIGMVSEDGQHEFYAERNDYRQEWASEFVKVSVVPHLGRISQAACNRDELRRRLWAWFEALPDKAKICSDSMRDRDLLWNALGEGLPAKLDPLPVALKAAPESEVFAAAIAKYHLQPECPEHHALHDAKALRAGWLAWSEHP